MARLVDSTIRLKEAFTQKELSSGKLVGSALGFLLSEEGQPLLVRLQCEGPICATLDGTPEHTRISIQEAELFNSSWDREGGKGKGYMPVVRAESLSVKETVIS